jgi:heme oxygenase
MRARELDRLTKRCERINQERAQALTEVYEAYNTRAITLDTASVLLGWLYRVNGDALPVATTFRKLKQLREAYNGEQQELSA